MSAFSVSLGKLAMPQTICAGMISGFHERQFTSIGFGSFPSILYKNPPRRPFSRMLRCPGEGLSYDTRREKVSRTSPMGIGAAISSSSPSFPRVIGKCSRIFRWNSFRDWLVGVSGRCTADDCHSHLPKFHFTAASSWLSNSMPFLSSLSIEV